MPGMCIAIVSGVLPNRAERGFFRDAVCFDPPQTTRTRSLPAAKQTKARKEKDPFACIESPQSLTVQFQRREYFMKMKHPKVTGIIKAYKSLKRLRLLFSIVQHAHMHPHINYYYPR